MPAASQHPRLKLVILDRDGVINHESERFIRSPEEWRPLDGALQAIAGLTAAGFTVVVASNQSGVGRGLFSAATLEAIHRKMSAAVEAAGGRIDRIFVCPHAPDAGCDCRKPLPGLLHQVAAAYGTTLEGVPVIGDSERDIRATQSAGARALLVRTGNGRATEPRLTAADGVEVFDDLAQAARFLTGTRQ